MICQQKGSITGNLPGGLPALCFACASSLLHPAAAAALPQTEAEYEKEKLNERIARLSGGVAVIQVRQQAQHGRVAEEHVA